MSVRVLNNGTVLQDRIALNFIGATISDDATNESCNVTVADQVSAQTLSNKTLTNFSVPAAAQGMTAWWTGNVGIALATSGNDTACTVGDIYWAPIFVPHNGTMTGINYLIGSVGGTDKAIVGLYNSAGVLLASSALAGTTVGTAANFQPLDFTAPLAVTGPALYFAAVQFNGTTAKFRTHTAPGLKFVANTQAGAFGTMAAISPGTTYVANKGPIAVSY